MRFAPPVIYWPAETDSWHTLMVLTIDADQYQFINYLITNINGNAVMNGTMRFDWVIMYRNLFKVS